MFGVIAAAHTYLRGYAIDCVFTAIFFCFVGYFNGCGKTIFVMVQGLVGAFCVRVPAVFLLSRLEDVSLFHIALATPLSSWCRFSCASGPTAYTGAPRRSSAESAGPVGSENSSSHGDGCCYFCAPPAAFSAYGAVLSAL